MPPAARALAMRIAHQPRAVTTGWAHQVITARKATSKHMRAMNMTRSRLGWRWAVAMRKAMSTPTMAKIAPWRTVYWATRPG